MSRRWASWIHDSLEPTEGEVDRVRYGLPPKLLDDLRQATTPSEDEVASLLRNRAAWNELQAQRRWRVRGLPISLGMALAGAAALALFLRPVPYGAPPVPLQTAFVAPVLQLGPSIDGKARGQLALKRANEDGTEVALLDGSVTFEVDPEGRYRHLVVVAGDTEVEVKGTVFTVSRGGEGTAVSVERGVVEVRHKGQVAATLTAGQAWAEPRAVAVAPPPVELASEPEVVAEAPRAVSRPVRGEAAWAAIQRAHEADEDRRQLLGAIDAWLEAYSDSALAPKVKALRARVVAELEAQ